MLLMPRLLDLVDYLPELLMGNNLCSISSGLKEFYCIQCFYWNKNHF